MKSNMKSNMKNSVIIYRIIISILFVYIFIQFLTMKRTNAIYRFYTDYIMNKYCIILYVLLILLTLRYDNFTAIILFILVIIPFKFSIKEFFETPSITPSITLNALLDSEILGIDNRFKMDEIAKDQILRQIKSQIEFDPYKTNLAKDVINDIYNKYFDNNIFVKLKNTNNDSKQYIASGNFKYLPENNRVDYDLVTYQNLSNNVQIGINPIVDGINNKTKINRG